MMVLVNVIYTDYTLLIHLMQRGDRRNRSGKTGGAVLRVIPMLREHGCWLVQRSHMDGKRWPR